MSFRHASPRVVLKLLIGLVIASGFATVGCGPSGVGSSPSSKDQMKRFFAQGGRAPLAVKPTGKDAKVVGPMSIKKRVFAGGAHKAANE